MSAASSRDPVSRPAIVPVPRKRIGVDLLLLSQFSYTGMVTYVQAILPYLIRAFPEWDWILFSRRQDLGFAWQKYSHVTVKQSRWMQSDWGWKLFGLSWECRVERLSGLFIPAARLPLRKTCPCVVMVHDMGFRSLPEYLKTGTVWLTEWGMRRAVRGGDVILTNSEFTKREICSAYQISPERIFVTYCGHDPEVLNPCRMECAEPESILQTYGIRRPYVLYLGILQARKNLTALIDAYDHWHIVDPALQLVLAGKRGWKYQPVYDRACRYTAEQVCLPGPVRPEHLRILYQNAECCVLPSWYEGFGIPVIEAMACGTPVAAANRTALPEVGGTAALYFDPANAEEIAEKILHLRRSPELRKNLVAAGLSQAALFSWEACAEKAVAAFRPWLESELEYSPEHFSGVSGFPQADRSTALKRQML